MKARIIQFFFILFLMTSPSCLDDDNNGSNGGITGIGEIQTETRDIDPFSKIKFQASGEIHFTQAPATSLRIEAQQNILDILTTKVVNEELIISFDVNVRQHDGVDIYLTSPELTNLLISGAANFSMENRVEVDELSIEISGVGNIITEDTLVFNQLFFVSSGVANANMNLESTGSVDFFQSGVANLKLQGDQTLESSKYTFSGAGNIDALGLSSNHVDVIVSGAGNCHVFAIETLTVTISGTGNVFYKGDPSITSNISGFGKLIKEE